MTSAASPGLRDKVGFAPLLVLMMAIAFPLTAGHLSAAENEGGRTGYAGREGTGSSAGSVFEWGRELDGRLGRIREQFTDLAMAALDTPSTLAAASRTVLADNPSPLSVLLLKLGALWLAGWGCEQLFVRWARVWMRRVIAHPLETPAQRLGVQSERLLFSQLIVIAFGAGVLLAYVGLSPSGLLGLVFLDVVIGTVALRIVLSVARFLLAPGGPRFRLLTMPSATAKRCYRWVAVLAITTFVGLEAAALVRLGGSISAAITVATTTLLADALLVPVAVAAVATLSRDTDSHAPRAFRLMLAVLPIVLWLLGAAGLGTAAWLLFAAGLAPILSVVLSDVSRTLVFGPKRGGTLTPHERLTVRAARTAAVVLALLLLFGVLRAGAQGGGVIRLPFAFSAITAIIILLVADLCWQLVRGLIERRLSASAARDGLQGDRLATVLPALRTAVFIAIGVITGLSVLSAFGWQIGPLLAGAGVVGLSIGFGAQTLVRDVIAGLFLLIDDAFRVGETIESGVLQGQVESFSLRSVRLRDDSGRLHTVAFGELKAVTNVSRDWAGMELPIYVAHAVPLDAVEAVIDAAITALEADDAYAGALLTRPRFLGATSLSESSMKLVIAIKTAPGRQFAIRSALLRRILDGMAAANLPVGVEIGAARPTLTRANTSSV